MVLRMLVRDHLLLTCVRLAGQHSILHISIFIFVVVACEGIGFGLHTDTFSANFCDAVWDPESKSKATSLVYALTNFELIT